MTQSRNDLGTRLTARQSDRSFGWLGALFLGVVFSGATFVNTATDCGLLLSVSIIGGIGGALVVANYLVTLRTR